MPRGGRSARRRRFVLGLAVPCEDPHDATLTASSAVGNVRGRRGDCMRDVLPKKRRVVAGNYDGNLNYERHTLFYSNCI